MYIASETLNFYYKFKGDVTYRHKVMLVRTKYLKLMSSSIGLSNFKVRSIAFDYRSTDVKKNLIGFLS